MTRETFDAGMDLLIKQWPNYPVNPDVYWMVLHDLDDSVFRVAVLGCLETCKFFPAIAELREKAIAALSAAGAVAPEGEQAWALLLDAMRCKRDLATGDYSGWDADNGWVDKYGYTIGAPSPLPPMVEQAVRAIGGLSVIAYASGNELGFLRRDFLAFYGHKREMELTYTPDLLSQALPAAWMPRLLEKESR